MSADHPSGSEPKPQQPRLPRRLDEHLDPGVTLPEVPGDESPRPPIARPGSAEILDRLQDRGASKPRYRLDGELARGGMGAILKAYDEDLRRDLAMKVMLDGKGGSGATPDQVDERSLARFLEEAQVTGQLDHPGIVPVHELGLDDGGRVYFTMQLVRGRDLDSVLPEIDAGDGEWTLTRALGVVLRVCEAMAYAHERGVVHRDLKPGNVMVGRFGEVYVMDWGLARVAGHDDGRDLRVREADPADADDGSGQPASELRTMDGDVIGTPAYMAPEQARGEIDRVDARSDVYAVGAILYRLLTGSAPHMPRQGRRTTIEVLLAVRREPPEPIEQLRKGVPAELVAICDKAMARDPADRYQGMMALAADLRAYLEHRVVAAYETGAWAEARKWVRRNRAFAGALAVAATLLVAGLFVSLMLKQLADEQAALAEQRRESAARSADEARRQAGIATAVNSFLNDDMLAALAPEHDGVAVTVRDVLQQASASIAFRTDLEPEVEAALRLTIGTSFERLGEHRRAEPHLTRALALRRRELGDDAEPTLQAMRAVALCCEDLGRLAEAEELLQEMQTAARGLFGDDHRATLSATGDLVRVRAARAGRAIARADCEQLLAASERVLGAMHPDTITARNNLGVLLQARGDHDGAERSLVAALEARKAVHGSRHGSTIDSMLNLAVLRVAQGRFAAAERLQ
ncbi:MAG: serine/threonine protein kinase, partial [Planctomycetes bacterium]|nr:serine/threonine protein kinase [Planctomycetota bacterium]